MERKKEKKEVRKKKTRKGKQEGGEGAGMFTVVQLPVPMQTTDTTIAVRIFPGLMFIYNGTNTRGYLLRQSASACSYQVLTV